MIIQKDTYFVMPHWRFSKRKKRDEKGKLKSYTGQFGEWRAYPNGFPFIGVEYPLEYVGYGNSHKAAYINMLSKQPVEL